MFDSMVARKPVSGNAAVQKVTRTIDRSVPEPKFNREASMQVGSNITTDPGTANFAQMYNANKTRAGNQRKKEILANRYDPYNAAVAARTAMEDGSFFKGTEGENALDSALELRGAFRTKDLLDWQKQNLPVAPFKEKYNPFTPVANKQPAMPNLFRKMRSPF